MTVIYWCRRGDRRAQRMVQKAQKMVQKSRARRSLDTFSPQPKRRRHRTADGVGRSAMAAGTVMAPAKPVSDTDEELPLFDMVNSSFSVGDLIWVRFRQYPFWPALVSSSICDRLTVVMMMMKDDDLLTYCVICFYAIQSLDRNFSNKYLVTYLLTMVITETKDCSFS